MEKGDGGNVEKAIVFGEVLEPWRTVLSASGYNSFKFMLST